METDQQNKRPPGGSFAGLLLVDTATPHQQTYLSEARLLYRTRPPFHELYGPFKWGQESLSGIGCLPCSRRCSRKRSLFSAFVCRKMLAPEPGF